MLIGRDVEIGRLEKIYKSSEAEFVVLYGRRRIGKTFLIRNFFEKKDCQFFQATGLQKGSLKKQLENFSQSLSETFMQGVTLKAPGSWNESFLTLTQLISSDKSKKKAVVFLDELPWLATRRSGLLQALDYFWNHYWSRNSRVILIVCGSSASWLINNIIYNKGGLHNRCTCEMKLSPFNLSEVNLYLKSKGIKLNKNHILQIYMALGGVPYYLNYVESGLTAHENIQKIFFENRSPLRDEFKKLFTSLFTEADSYIELIKLIAKKKAGISRAELESLSQLTQGGGRLTERLDQLIQANFIESYIPWEKERGEFYKVIDEFCLFYMYWLSTTRGKRLTGDHWLKQMQKPIYHVWSGYAFEAICYKNIDRIIQALNIKTAENIAAWRWVSKIEKEDGTQIDLLINRSDNAITLCEIKYTSQAFAIDKAYAKNLMKKIEIFREATRTEKQIFLAIISANGLKPTLYSEELVDGGVVTLSDLFI